MFVTVVDVMQFADCWTQKMKFFVSYEIKNEHLAVKMTMDAGEIDVDACTIYGSESEISSGKLEIYKDILAVTSVSTLIEMTVKFEKPPQMKLQEFMKTTLMFAQLTDNAAVPNVSRDY